MTVKFPLGMLAHPDNLMDKMPAPVEALLKSDVCAGINITLSFDKNDAIILTGVHLCINHGDSVTWTWDWEILNAIKGVPEAITALGNSHWLAAYVLQSVWNDTYTDFDGPTYVCLTILPSGMIMGIDDCGSVLDQEFGALEEALSQEDPEELAYQASPEGFPTYKLASIIVDSRRLQSGHEQLRLIEDMNTIVQDWVKTLHDDTTGLSFLTKVPWCAPELR